MAIQNFNITMFSVVERIEKTESILSKSHCFPKKELKTVFGTALTSLLIVCKNEEIKREVIMLKVIDPPCSRYQKIIIKRKNCVRSTYKKSECNRFFKYDPIANSPNIA